MVYLFTYMETPTTSRMKGNRPSNLQDHAVRPAREAAAMARKMGDKQPGKPSEDATGKTQRSFL